MLLTDGMIIPIRARGTGRGLSAYRFSIVAAASMISVSEVMCLLV